MRGWSRHAANMGSVNWGAQKASSKNNLDNLMGSSRSRRSERLEPLQAPKPRGMRRPHGLPPPHVCPSEMSCAGQHTHTHTRCGNDRGLRNPWRARKRRPTPLAHVVGAPPPSSSGPNALAHNPFPPGGRAAQANRGHHPIALLVLGGSCCSASHTRALGMRPSAAFEAPTTLRRVGHRSQRRVLSQRRPSGGRAFERRATPRAASPVA